MMSNGAAVADADRLPWLEPHRESPRPRARPPRRRSSGQGWLAAGAVVTLLAAAGGGYWLGLNDTSDPRVPAAASEPARTAVVPLPEPAPLALPPRPAEAEPNAAPPVIAPGVENARRDIARPVKKKAKRRYRARAKIRNAGIEQEKLDAIRSQQETAAPVTAPPRVWPRLPSPGPAGQVIQLGAFTHPDRAYRAYSARLARYPALGRMPRVIVPIAPRSNGKIYYALRLGTASRQQSKTVCRNLRRSGDHCLVIG